MKKIFLACMLMLTAFAASAQENGTTVNVFQPHMYVQLQAGGQYTLGERPFNYLLSPNAQVALGYQFNPVFGLRLDVNAWQSKAGIDKIEGRPDVKWKWNYVAPTLDATFNLSNLFFGFNPNRLMNWSVFAGAGVNIGFNNDDAFDAYKEWNASFNGLYAPQNMDYLWDGTKVRFAGKLGTMLDFRISDAVSAGIELNATVLNDHYNSKDSDNPDWYFNALAGVKINLGKTHTTKFVPAPAPQVVEKVIERVVEKPAPATSAATSAAGPGAGAVAAKKEPLRREVFFDLCSAVIKGDESAKVQEIADYLKKYPEAKVSLCGYADKGTGNAKVNASWAAKRVQAVKDALVNKYGISESKINVDSKGDTVQPFAENNKNRVTICIAE